MLFPEFARPTLIGIAKQAAGSELLEAKARVQYFELPTRRFLSPVRSRRVPFCWAINPYRGCEFGCRYCYARYTHEFMELRESAQFEEMIYAKQFDKAAFRQELRSTARQESIAIGTGTDPYQPAERRFGVTRQILEVLAGEKGRRISLVTKSDLVARDALLFQTIARSNVLHVNITITTLDERLARLLETWAPRPALRVAAVRALAEAGIHVGVLPNPIVPLITDSEENLDSVAAAAAQAGAESFGGGVLFLKPCSRRVFFPFLAEHFPHLLRRYRERYEESAFLRGSYPDSIRERVHRVRQRHGLMSGGANYEPELWEGEPQLVLFDVQE